MVQPKPLIARSGSVRPVGGALSPLMEGPEPDRGESGDPKWVGSVIGQWVKGQLFTSTNHRKSNLRLLLGIMGAPLAPVHVSSIDPLPHLSIKDTPIVSPPFILSLFSYLFNVNSCRSIQFSWIPNRWIQKILLELRISGAKTGF